LTLPLISDFFFLERKGMQIKSLKYCLLSPLLLLLSVRVQPNANYSSNSVGYLNTVLKPGYNLISNPLIARDNRISVFFNGVPNQSQVYKFDGTSFSTATFSTILGGWNPPSASELTVLPGEGVFFRNPTSNDITNSFVGEVMQGNLTNSMPVGLSIRSSQVPIAGTLDPIFFPASNQDQAFQFNPVLKNILLILTPPFSEAGIPHQALSKSAKPFSLEKIQQQIGSDLLASMNDYTHPIIETHVLN
jgi:hypothetical protein